LRRKKASVHWSFSSTPVALVVWYKPLANHQFLGLCALTAVEGLELFPQVPKRERERKNRPQKSTIAKP
jgi:hypothetical protein